MPIKYVPFIPEPVEGQAVLGNFNRILRYKGADDVSMTLQRGMPLYEMEKQETVGENSDGNMVIRGECVSACAYLKEQGIQVDLVYIDPPFASGADYAKKVYIRRNPKVAEVIAQAEQELDVDELKAFEEKMYGDVWDKEKYLNWMYENLMAIKSVMSENASIYGVQLYRNPVQTMDKIKFLIPGLKNEDSLDSFWEGAISDSKLGTIPAYVPNLMDSASKLLDKVTMNRIIHQAIPELDNDIKKVIVYYIDITDEVEIMNFIKEDDSTTVEIELRDLKSILDDVVIGDYAEFHAEEIAGGYAVAIDKFMSDRVLSKITEFNQKAFLNSSAKKPYKSIEISEEGLELIEFLSLDCTANGGEWHSDSEIKIDKNGYVIVDGNKTKEFWDGYIRSKKKPLRLKIRNICGDETVWEV